MALRWALLVVVAWAEICPASSMGASSMGAEAGPALDVPNSLSCSLQQGWPSVAAALSVEAGQGPEPTDALPRMCQKLDLDLVRWMVGEVLNLAWAENTSDAVQDFYEEQYYCEPRLDKILREETQEECRAAISSTVHSACLYGSASIFACILSMLFRHPQQLDAPDLLSFAKHSLLAIRWFLHSEHRWMEFLDSSDWPVTLTDLVNIMDAYGDVLALEDLSNASSSRVRGLLRQSRKAWNAGSFSWLKATLAAKQSLAAVQGWQSARWFPQPRRPPTQTSVAALRLWAFGTHCSVMAEPVSVMTTLLSDEFQINVSWQGASDYCQYHHGAQRDGHSAVRKLYMKHWRKAGTRPASEAHRDSLSNAKDFAEELQALLRQDQDFQHSDVAFCSEPAIACLSMHRAGKPVIGYFGVHIAFMLNQGEEQKSLYQAFVDELSQDARNSFATKAPYLSLQIYSHTSLKFPSVRPLSLYTQPVTYSGATSTEILLNRRPVLFWNRRLLLNSLAYLNGFDLKFQEVKSLSDKTFGHWLSHRAGLYFPYDWLQTMGFYDWINMAFPTFVPDTPMYTYTMMGTNHRGWTATIFSPPKDLYPYKYQDWNDLESRVFWWHMTDFKVLPTVQLFQSLPQLFQMLTQASMNSISAQMHLGQKGGKFM